MLIFVESCVYGWKIALEVEESDSIKLVKKIVKDKEGVPLDEQRLVYEGKQLEDHRTLADYKIQNETLLFMIRRLPGGGLCHFSVTTEGIGITSDDFSKTLKCSSFHFSCTCDIFCKDFDYAGAVFWGTENGESNWTLNNRKCSSGYIIIKQPSSLTAFPSSEGQIHGSLFKSVFGSEPSQANPKLIGSGFAFKNGAWVFNSYTFNTGTSFHDNSRTCNEEQIMIKNAVDAWVRGNYMRQNFSVRELDPIYQTVT